MQQENTKILDEFKEKWPCSLQQLVLEQEPRSPVPALHENWNSARQELETIQARQRRAREARRGAGPRCDRRQLWLRGSPHSYELPPYSWHVVVCLAAIAVRLPASGNPCDTSSHTYRSCSCPQRCQTRRRTTRRSRFPLRTRPAEWESSAQFLS